MVMEFEPAAKDDPTLLDITCKGGIKGLNGTITKYDEVKMDGKSARSFAFKTKTQGRNVLGIGLCVATSPVAVKIAMAFDTTGSDVRAMQTPR